MKRLSPILLAGTLLMLGSRETRAQNPAVLQSFVAPGAATTLESFTFSGITSSTVNTFGLYRFDGTHLTTSALWSEAIFGPLHSTDVLTFSPHATVTGGDQYAIGITISGETGNTASADILPNGRFYIASGNGYDAVFGEHDANGFTVSFDTVTTPEPASLALLATGLVGFALVRRRRITAP